MLYHYTWMVDGIKTHPIGMPQLSEQQSEWLERAALSALVACLAYCLALPLLLAALPVLSTVVDVPDLWILAFAVRRRHWRS